MSYTPPAGDDIAAEFSGVTYTPPVGDTIFASFAPIGASVDAAFIASFPSLTMSSTATYDSNVQRPLVGEVHSAWQVGRTYDVQIESVHQVAQAAPVQLDTGWQVAKRMERELVSLMPNDSVHVRNDLQSHYQLAKGLETDIGIRAQYGARVMRGIESKYQIAATLQTAAIDLKWEAPYRRSNHLVSHWQIAKHLDAELMTRNHLARKISNEWLSRYQVAKWPDAGISAHVPPIIPFDPCYLPPPGDAVHLLFDAPWVHDTDLLFQCDLHPVIPPGVTIVVPIREVYVVLNTVLLKRVSDNFPLPADAISMTLDTDQWSWMFRASLPGWALPYVMPVDGEPVELEANINGNIFRILAQGISRDRSFNRSSITISGAGKAARLDTPIAPIMNFTNTEERSANQLMIDALTFNGVPLGWDVDFGLEDWQVPTGMWNFQGSYLKAVQAIAAAAGGYLQPHRTLDVIRVLPRYPIVPWNWLTEITPDYELPSAVVSTEGIDWITKPSYNRVFVSGQGAGGILGQVTREGTDGSLVAPMIVDSLITSAIAARQRGLSVLSDVGRQAAVTIRLPVLEETGVIEPGKFVRYVDGATTRLGIVRNVNVEARRPNVYQTLQVETHE